MSKASQNKGKGNVPDTDETIPLSQEMQKHLCEAFEEMDLLLGAQKTEVGVQHLVALLQHLRAVRYEMVSDR